MGVTCHCCQKAWSHPTATRLHDCLCQHKRGGGRRHDKKQERAGRTASRSHSKLWQFKTFHEIRFELRRMLSKN